MEEALVDHMRQQAPDQTGGGEEPLYIREVNQWLLAQGHDSALPVRVTRLLRSLAQTGTELQPGNPNLRLRLVAQERMHVTLNTTWTQLADSAARRRKAARTVVRTLRDSLETDARGADLLASTTTGELTEALRLDGQVTAAVDVSRLLQQALLWLHDQEVIRLNQGMTIMRPAMSIEIRDRRRQFTNADYEPLDLHYTEQTVQVHIMAQYARTGLESAADALALALDYFTMPRAQFTARWMAGRSQDLRRRTTPESYQRIVTSLNNRAQQEIVTQDRDGRNTLLLAGPGSGKTRVLVHRIAYLVRVRRENPRSILALAYNRHAAVQIRQRLRELIGDESSGVAVLTCHSLAMRLVGRTFESNQARTDEEASKIFDQILQEATRRLAGLGPGEAEERDELRDRLLGGFRWVLVDEYQDIKKAEYELISALTGQDRGEEDQLNIFAVGDDDQNIYAFSGSSTEYIRRFQEDYRAHESYMTENYLSTRNIIEAANAVIGRAADRLKREHPITVDTVRTLARAGGAREAMDPVAMGRVQILPASDDRITQAVAAVEELKRLGGVRCPVGLEPVRRHRTPVGPVGAGQGGLRQPGDPLAERTRGLHRHLAAERDAGPPRVGGQAGERDRPPRGPGLAARPDPQHLEHAVAGGGGAGRIGVARGSDAPSGVHRMAGGVGPGQPAPAARPAADQRAPRQGAGVRPRRDTGPRVATARPQGRRH